MATESGIQPGITDVAVDRRRVALTDTPLLRVLFSEAHPELMLLPVVLREGVVDLQFYTRRRQYAGGFPHAPTRCCWPTASRWASSWTPSRTSYAWWI